MVMQPFPIALVVALGAALQPASDPQLLHRFMSN
jgi:hypothetical protein